VDRRRLVHASDDRLEVSNRERVGVNAAIPRDDVERVILVKVPGPTGSMPYQHRYFLPFAGEWSFRGPQVSL